MPNSLRQAAQTYVPKSAKNITELKSVDADLLFEIESGVNKDGEEFTYNYITIDDVKYRVPDSVLKDLKSILEKKPALKTFCVSKSGEGRNTKYTVIPLD
jgi:hypothetical protein